MQIISGHIAGHCPEPVANLTINSTVFVATVQKVVLEDIQQTSHLTEDEHTRASGLQPGQKLVQQYQLSCESSLRS